MLRSANPKGCLVVIVGSIEIGIVGATFGERLDNLGLRLFGEGEDLVEEIFHGGFARHKATAISRMRSSKNVWISSAVTTGLMN